MVTVIADMLLLGTERRAMTTVTRMLGMAIAVTAMPLLGTVIADTGMPVTVTVDMLPPGTVARKPFFN